MVKEMRFTQEQILKQMKANHCTKDEAIDILAWDYAIDHGDTEKGAMTAEQKKMVRNLTKAEKAPTEKRTVKRERKIDENKKEVFGWVKTMLEGMELNGKVENLTCKNEAEISFMHGGEAFTIKFTKHRAPKD